MLSLSPAKLLVVLVIALMVLGPDKLPQLARRAGALWGDLRRWRTRLESDVRSTFPDLPPTHEVVRAVRAPLAFLDTLADAHETSASNGDGPAVVTTPAEPSRPPDEGAPDARAAAQAAPRAGDGAAAIEEGAGPGVSDRASPTDGTNTDTRNGSDAGRQMHDGGVHGGVGESGGTAGTPGWGLDDPAMN